MSHVTNYHHHNTGHMAKCQWPECDFYAVVCIRTLHVPNLYLCPTHRLAWYELSYLEMVDVSANRQPKRYLNRKPGNLHSIEGVTLIGQVDGGGYVYG